LVVRILGGYSLAIPLTASTSPDSVGKCLPNGKCIEDVLHDFCYYLQTVDAIVGHNVSFDIDMVKVELLRCIYLRELSQDENKLYKQNLHFITNYKNINCTMKENIDFCSIHTLDKKGNPYFKYPKLVELHQKIFASEPKNLHNSLNDIIVTLRCFIKIKFDKDITDNKHDNYADLYDKIFN
jgi:DNA polymerase III epsilon subunit-like protein